MCFRAGHAAAALALMKSLVAEPENGILAPLLRVAPEIPRDFTQAKRFGETFLEYFVKKL